MSDAETHSWVSFSSIDEFDEISSKLDCPTRGWTAQNDELSNLSNVFLRFLMAFTDYRDFDFFSVKKEKARNFFMAVVFSLPLWEWFFY